MTLEKPKSIAVLSSGGIESSILLARYADAGWSVYPLYVACGFLHEKEERKALIHYIRSLKNPAIQRTVILKTSLHNILTNTWTYTGKNIPGPDENQTLIIPGRNLLLLTLAALWCTTHGCGDIALGITGFPGFYDQREEFITACEHSLSLGTHTQIHLHVDFREKKKSDLLRQYAYLPLHRTLSCLDTQNGMHCGTCNKCDERRNAYHAAGLIDSTLYSMATS